MLAGFCCWGNLPLGLKTVACVDVKFTTNAFDRYYRRHVNVTTVTGTFSQRHDRKFNKPRITTVERRHTEGQFACVVCVE